MVLPRTLPTILAALLLVVSPVPAADEEPPPSLDDLLGIEEGADAGEGEAARAEAAQAELERRLDEDEIADAFLAAVARMRDVAERLEARFDTGVGTQRAQEEILARLDSLIDAARRQQASNSSCSQGSPGSSSPSDSAKPSDPGQQPERKPGDGSSPTAARRNAASDAVEGDPPPMQEGDLAPLLEESRSEWGHLPQRVRDMLMQGRREKFSSLYERLTREYYRRLAEEGTP